MKYIKVKKIVDESYKVDFFSDIIASAFFVGYAPKASGTFGAALGMMFFLIPGFGNIYLLITLIIVFTLIGIFTSEKMVKRYGDDPSVVVIDEVVGSWFTVLVFKLFFSGYDVTDWIFLIAAFLSFRFFDILKIFPASYFDKMKNGFGIMADDIAAGLNAGMAAVILKIFLNLLNISII